MKKNTVDFLAYKTNKVREKSIPSKDFSDEAGNQDVGLSEDYIRKVENGEITPTGRSLRILLEALDIDLEETIEVVGPSIVADLILGYDEEFANDSKIDKEKYGKIIINVAEAALLYQNIDKTKEGIEPEKSLGEYILMLAKILECSI